MYPNNVTVVIYGRVLPEDGAITAETCRRVLIIIIIIPVFYCIYAFCWHIKEIITVRKVHGIVSFNKALRYYMQRFRYSPQKVTDKLTALN